MDKELDDVEEAQKGMTESTDAAEEAGRGTDTVMGHLSLGEIVIPRAFLDDPEVMQILQQIFEAGGADINQYTVGHKANSINPETGYPEFGFGKFFKKALGIALPVAASFIPGIGPVAAAGLGAAGGALSGGGLRSALLGGLTSGIGAGLTGNTTGALNGTFLGRLENSISGALSPIGSAIKGGLSNLGAGVSGALDGIGDATGLSGLYNTASDGVSNAYSGSVLQNTLKSGSDLLGLNTSSNSLGSGIGATAGGGSSSYGPTELPWLTQSTPEVGANTVRNSTDYLSPISSALLGSRTNAQAEKQLLQQQAANRALYEPYLNFRFNPGDLTQDPGYQFNLAEGTKALDRAQLARGGYFSGNALREAQTFGQGLADNTYNTAFNRALQTNEAGLRGAGAMAGVNENIGNIRANSTVNTGNLYSGALGSILGGNSYNNTGALQGGSNGDFLSNLLRQLAMQRQGAFA